MCVSDWVNKFHVCECADPLKWGYGWFGCHPKWVSPTKLWPSKRKVSALSH